MMNVSTSTANTSSTHDVSSAQTKVENTQTAEKSFEEEMKTASETEETKAVEKPKDVQKEEPQVVESADELIASEMISGNINFTDFKYHNESQAILSQNIQKLLNTKDLISTVNSAVTVDYDAVKMSDDDASFFVNLVQNTDMSMKDIAVQVSENANVQTAKSIQVSSVLMEKLAESLKTNQPFRIDFDKDVSVIIKVNKDGSLMANFIPGDKAVEQYLRNNIAALKQRFDDENLSYSELSYSNSRDQKQQRRKKENDNE